MEDHNDEEVAAATRQRGGSVATEATHDSVVLDTDTKRQLLDSMPHSIQNHDDDDDNDGELHEKSTDKKRKSNYNDNDLKKQRRKRTASDMSEESSSSADNLFGESDNDDAGKDGKEKRRLKQPHNDQEGVTAAAAANGNQKSSSVAAAAGRKRSSSDMSGSSASSDMFGSDDDDGVASSDNQQKPRRKKTKLDLQGNIPEEVIKGRLSKWAARLFDPDRPRGLVESPQEIPLNDEFLKAFGQREKEFDKAKGISILKVDKEILDESDNEDDAKIEARAPSTKEADGENKTGVKVKISNLKFTTSLKVLLEACSYYGAVTECNLLMEDDGIAGGISEASGETLNKGRAYVVFDTEEGATACMENLTHLDGRPLRIDLAKSASGRSRPSLGSSAPSRYYNKDISTKCFRCGEVGHREMDCTNPARAKPCPICAGIDHDIRVCPVKAICFNCGVPGHVSRNCSQPRGVPQKAICTVCFQNGHTKYDCRQSYRDAAAISQAALCMVCGEEGHYLCEPLQWFFGVQGVTCSNCGQSGHIGRECTRLKYEVLDRDPELARLEVERVQDEENSMAQGRRDRRMDFSSQRRRAQSAPPNSRIGARGSQYRPQEPRGRR